MKHTLRFRTVNKDIFLDIKKGRKTVETRAATERYQNIKAGDTLVLVCGKEKIEKKIKKVKLFKTIATLLNAYSLKRIMPNLNSAKEWRKELYTYPDYKEKIKKFGLVALEL